MNWVDRTIAAFSPEAGLRRVRARVALNAIDRVDRQRLGYDGAKAGRRLDGWMRPGSSANAEVGAALKHLRDGARDLVRNYPLARKALWELQSKTVGSGIRPQARSQYPAANKVLDEKFEQWSKECNADGRPGYYGLQGLFARCMFESGEVLLRFRQRLPSDGLTIPLQLQLLEPDFLDHTKTLTTDTGYILQGVEFNKLGRRQAYWLYGTHPGEIVNTNWFGRGSNSSAPVPTSEIEHGFIIERPGQVRGVTWFSAVIAAMHDLDGYQDAERVRKRIEACLAAFITQPEGEGSTLTDSSTDTAGKRIEGFEPGMIVYNRPGSAVTLAEPKAAGGYAEYVRTEQYAIAAGLCLLYAVLTGDLSDVTYSSYRGGVISLKSLIEYIQWEFIIPVVGDPVWKRFVDMCRIAGYVPADTSYGVEWAPPPFEMLDRGAEAEADKAMMRSGTMTWAQAVGRQGYDPEKQLAEIAAWNKKFDDAGIVLDCDPRKVANTGAVQKTDGGANGTAQAN
jgi:lambda family phage portal protein